MSTLPSGYMLNWFRIESVLGRGSFGVTYLALDTNLQQKVAIKEYMPQELSLRSGTEMIVPVDNDGARKTYAWGLTSFVTEARTLSQFEHPNIVNVLTVFEANGTAYLVMKYEPGVVLTQAWADGAPRDEATLRHLLFCLADGLRQVHRAGFIHRDIKPGNIYLRERSGPVLLDFGSARQQLGANTKHQLTTLYTPGYAPIEQYDAGAERSQQGPFTDIYSLGATIYHGICGRGPVDAMSRASAILDQRPDPLLPLAEREVPGFSRELLTLIDRALGLRPAQRPQTVDEWLSQAATATVAPAHTLPPAASADTGETVILGTGSHPMIGNALTQPPGVGTTSPNAPASVPHPSLDPVENLDPLAQLAPDTGGISANPADRSNTARRNTQKPGRKPRSTGKSVAAVALLAGLAGVTVWQQDAWYPLIQAKFETQATSTAADDSDTATSEPGSSTGLPNSSNPYPESENLPPNTAQQANSKRSEPTNATTPPAPNRTAADRTGSRNGGTSDRNSAPQSTSSGSLSARTAPTATSSGTLEVTQSASRASSAALEIGGELDAAARYFTAGRMVEPAGANARDSYLRVLELDPGNADAERGLLRLVRHYEQRAQSAIWQNQPELAREHAEAAMAVAPDHAPTARVAERLHLDILAAGGNRPQTTDRGSPVADSSGAAILETPTPAPSAGTQAGLSDPVSAEPSADPAPAPPVEPARTPTTVTTSASSGDSSEDTDSRSRTDEWLESFGLDPGASSSDGSN